MTSDEMLNLLKVGLTEGEAKVYISLSELGSTTVGPIVKSSKVAYSNIYDILNRLIDKGVVSFIVKNKTKYFQAATPSNLLSYLDKKQKEISNQKQLLNKMLPDLEKLHEIKPQQEAEIFLGKKGLRTAYEKLLKNSTENDEILFFYIHEEEYAEESDMFYKSIEHLSKEIKNRGVCNEKYRDSLFAKGSGFLNLRFVKFPIPGTIDILNEKILIVSWKSPTIAILINSKDIAGSYREYFEDVWKKAKS